MAPPFYFLPFEAVGCLFFPVRFGGFCGRGLRVGVSGELFPSGEDEGAEDVVRFDFHFPRHQGLAEAALQIGFGAAHVHLVFQTAQVAEVVDVLIRRVCIHELAEERLVEAHVLRKAADALVVVGHHVLGDVVAEGFALFDLQFPGLHIHEDAHGVGLLLLRQIGERFVQLRQHRIRFRLVLQSLHVLAEAGVHVIGVDAVRVDFREIRVDFKGDLLVASVSLRPVSAEKLLVPERQLEIRLLIQQGNDLLAVDLFLLRQRLRDFPVLVDVVFELIPAEALHLRRLERFIQLLERLGKGAFFFLALGQGGKILDTCALEKLLDMLEDLVHLPDIFAELFHKKTVRPVARIQVKGRVDILRHRIRIPVIPDDAEGLVLAENAVRPRKSLNQIFIGEHLVQIQRIQPLRVEAREHLIHHDEQVDLLLRLPVDGFIGPLVRQPGGDILLEPHRHVRHAVILAVPVVVVHDDLPDGLLLGDGRLDAIRVGVKERRHLELRSHGLEMPVILHRLGNARSGENGVEFPRVREHRPVVQNILHHRLLMPLAFILRGGDIVLDALHILALLLSAGHGDLVHEFQENLFLALVGERFLHRPGFSLFQRHRLPQVPVPVRVHLIRVESEHILVADAVREAVAVQLVSEYIRRGAVLLLILLLDGRPREPEEHRKGERLPDDPQHIPEGAPVRLVHDENDALLIDLPDVRRAERAVLADAAHLLNGRDDERVRSVVTLELRRQHRRILRLLHRLIRPGKIAVLVERLHAQLDAVCEEDHLVRIPRRRDELRRLEARHRLAGARRMPDIPAPGLLHIPPAAPFRHLSGDAARRVILVAPHHLQDAVLPVRHGVEADELMRHGDGQQRLRDAVVFVDGHVVCIRPVEIEILIEFPVRSGVGEIHRLLRIHRHEDLHQREKTGEDPFVGVLLDLPAGLTHIHAGPLQLHMDEGHPVDEEREIPAPLRVEIPLRRKDGLLGDLVAARPGGDLQPVEELQRHILAVVEPVRFGLPADGHAPAVDELIERHRRAQRPHLREDLLHLPVGERHVVQLVHAAVVVKKNVRPVPDEVVLRGVFQDMPVPFVFIREQTDESRLEVRFLCECHTDHLTQITCPAEPLSAGAACPAFLFEETEYHQGARKNLQSFSAQPRLGP